LLLLALGGCGPIVKSADFAYQPNSVRPGAPLGPFEGRVVDADTGNPIPDAVVQCTWAFVRGVGNATPQASRSTSVRTDVDGRYLVPALRQLPTGLSTRLSRFSMVIYKKGYAAYRNDFVFAGKRRRHHTFSQWENRVRLTRWSPELSHARHLLFIGGGLHQVGGWEALAAAAELDRRDAARKQRQAPRRPARPKEGQLDASVLLSSDEVRNITGFSGEFEQGRLAQPNSDTYASFHLKASERPERYDVALRLWRVPASQLTERYEKLLNALPGSKQTDEVSDRSFVVQQGEILGLGFMDRAASVVVLVTCGRGQCTTNEHLEKIAKTVQQNLHRLPSSSIEELLPSGGSQDGEVDEDEDEDEEQDQAGGKVPEAAP
jgi:hypothetical protein